jgi:thiamine pyrophosphate-dependent acetolactate synthase large subunit-like protein
MSPSPEALLDRRAFVRALLEDRGGLLVVSGLGSATYDVAAAGDHPLNLYQWGGMGGTLMIGLGLALAQPDRRVLVMTGDGDALMGLGSLATIGVKQAGNLVVVVLDNGRYGETGMQASHTSAGVNLVDVATACGFAECHTVSDQQDAQMVRTLCHEGRGPILIRAHISRQEVPRVLPTRDGLDMRERFARALLG